MSTLYVFLLILALVSVASFLIQRGSYSPRSATGGRLLFSFLGGGGIAVLVSCALGSLLVPQQWLPITADRSDFDSADRSRIFRLGCCADTFVNVPENLI